MINVIHVKSTGHSGSTLLNLLLAHNKGIFAGGHLFRYARLWTQADTLKTAGGDLIRDSGFWQDVKRRLAKEDKEPWAQDPAYRINPQDVINLFQAILESSGCAVICDNSKAGSFDRILYGPGFKTFMIHMVRDGRAVCNSLRKKDLFKFHTPLVWTADNLRLWLFNRGRPGYLLVRYEDLVKDRDAVLQRVLEAAAEFFSLDIRALETQGQETIAHMFAGNRMRNSFDGTIMFDTEYVRETGPLRWALLTMLMLPALLVFRYPLTRKDHA